MVFPSVVWMEAGDGGPYLVGRPAKAPENTHAAGGFAPALSVGFAPGPARR
jgi:hypothetical protein